MTVIHKSVLVPYAPEQMFGLVNDIRNYPKFVPACEASEIISQTEEEIRASLTFAKSGIRKTFSTLNRLQPYRMIEIRLLDGPFQQLEGFWNFHRTDNGHCNVVLDLEFEFSSRILKVMFGPIFQQATTMLVDSFYARAREVYG